MPRACVHAATFSLAKLHHCAHSRKCSVQNRRFYPYIFVYVLRAKCITSCVQICAQRAKYCVFSHCTVCKVYVWRAFMVACLHNFALGRAVWQKFIFYLPQDIYYSPAANWKCSRQCHCVCCEVHVTLLIIVIHWVTQNSLFISYYYMLTSELSVLCPPSPSQEFEYLWTWSVSKGAFFSPFETLCIWIVFRCSVMESQHLQPYLTRNSVFQIGNVMEAFFFLWKCFNAKETIDTVSDNSMIIWKLDQ